MPDAKELADLQGSLVTEDYLVTQVNTALSTDSHQKHKQRIRDYDLLYHGDLTALFPDEAALGKEPLVENKLKNATHDLARLASEQQGTPVFMAQGDSGAQLKKKEVREAIARTLWMQGRGAAQERRLFLDLIAAGYMALSVYKPASGEAYPQMLRLNPRMCYPDYRRGQLQKMLYVEEMKERQAAEMWPDAGLDKSVTNHADVRVVMYFDDKVAIQAVCDKKGKTGGTSRAYITSRWEHDLGCVPVAFEALDMADDQYHGLFEQLGGPMMIRNKAVRLLSTYMESMAHAPFEAKNIINANDEPGPFTIYQHDPNSQDSFMRRVAPATPASSMFNLLGYMDAQESSEAIQPPARVGVVSQSIASGSFVESTQGTLSSMIMEMQDKMASLRYQAQYMAMQVDEKFMDTSKSLWRAVGKKSMYTPSEDIGGFYYHEVKYGAGRALRRSEASARVLQDLGAGLISKELARQQLDYVDDIVSEQDRIDRENLANVFFQRFAADPATPLGLVATAIVEMGKGRSMLDVLEDLAPELVAYEQQQQAAQGAPAAGPPGAPAGAEEAAASQAEIGAGATQDITFAPPPLQQQIVRNPF